MNAEEIMKQIEQLSNGERIKLLDAMFDKYFDNRPPREVIDAFRQWYEESR